MEQLLQKYTKYFYIVLIGVILVQMLDVLFIAMRREFQLETVVVSFLSVINMILCASSLAYNIQQRFVECKISAKTLRFTIILLMGFQALLCFKYDPNWILLGNHLLALTVIEIVLSYRIKTIEYLEDLANKFLKDNKLSEKGK